MPAGLLIIWSLRLPDRVLEHSAGKSRTSPFQAQCGAKRGLKPERSLEKGLQSRKGTCSGGVRNWGPGAYDN